jgi:hypothetical protein
MVEKEEILALGIFAIGIVALLIGTFFKPKRTMSPKEAGFIERKQTEEQPKGGWVNTEEWEIVEDSEGNLKKIIVHRKVLPIE